MKKLNKLESKQIQQRLNKLRPLQRNSEIRGGWIRYIRHAMRMTLGNLAKAAKISPATIQQIEKRETTGKVTIETMQKIARAMECDFVYALVPKEDLQKLLTKKAHLKAAKIIKEADLHMTLEDQKVTESVKARIERVAEELLIKGDLW